MGGSKDEDKSSSSSSYDTGGFQPQQSYAAPQASSSISSFQQELQMEQQKALVQQVMLKLTDSAFEACITKPSSSLSSSETSCINAVVGKYLDASEYVVGKFQGQQGGDGGGY